MFIPVIAVFLMGGLTALAMETNIPEVSKFGDKYLCETCTPAEKAPAVKK